MDVAFEPFVIKVYSQDAEVRVQGTIGGQRPKFPFFAYADSELMTAVTTLRRVVNRMVRDTATKEPGT